ncbi:transcriptional regulator, IclR family [Burkholderia sp. GAS332]|uniref:IclR family transcriptional regulator n=1 Tax=Paraburkholderia sediminicola TaxID=458836 RepID=UPI00092B6F0E|nr:transcriptional regulator, IclR family [Burkholderia sp. GAS332]
MSKTHHSPIDNPADGPSAGEAAHTPVASDRANTELASRTAHEAHKDDRHFVTALARGLEVLACFRSGDKSLSNQELALRCKLPKSTVSRLTHTLTLLGYLIHLKESGKYRLGTASLALGSAMLARLDVRKIARPVMQELADIVGATVSLGTRDRLSMIYVENCRASVALTLTLEVGSRIPVATSAIGRAWLAAIPEHDRLSFMEQVRELDHVAWPKTRRGIENALEDYRTLGVTTSFGDWQKEVNGIARAFQPGGELPIMAINVGGPSFKLSKEFLLEEVRPRLIDVVTQLEIALSH